MNTIKKMKSVSIRQMLSAALQGVLAKSNRRRFLKQITAVVIVVALVSFAGCGKPEPEPVIEEPSGTGTDPKPDPGTDPGTDPKPKTTDNRTNLAIQEAIYARMKTCADKHTHTSFNALCTCLDEGIKAEMLKYDVGKKSYVQIPVVFSKGTAVPVYGQHVATEVTRLSSAKVEGRKVLKSKIDVLTGSDSSPTSTGSGTFRHAIGVEGDKVETDAEIAETYK